MKVPKGRFKKRILHYIAHARLRRSSHRKRRMPVTFYLVGGGIVLFIVCSTLLTFHPFNPTPLTIKEAVIATVLVIFLLSITAGLVSWLLKRAPRASLGSTPMKDEYQEQPRNTETKATTPEQTQTTTTQTTAASSGGKDDSKGKVGKKDNQKEAADRKNSKSWEWFRNFVWIACVVVVLMIALGIVGTKVKSGAFQEFWNGPPPAATNGVTVQAGPNAPVLLDPRKHQKPNPAESVATSAPAPPPISPLTSEDQESDCRTLDPVAGIRACTMHDDRFHGPIYPLNDSPIDLNARTQDRELPPAEWSVDIMYGNQAKQPNPGDVIHDTARGDAFHVQYHGPVWIRGTEGETVIVHPINVPAP